MTGGGGAARKPLNRRESALAAMRATLADFNQQNLLWEREVETLFDEAESVIVKAAFSVRSVTPPAPVEREDHNEQVEQLIHVVNHQQELARQQQAAVSELTMLRHLVEQKTEHGDRDEHGEQLVHVVNHQQELARQQQAAVSELTMLRHLVEQKTEQEDHDEHGEQLIHVASHQQELARQQQAAVSELTLLRHLVEQQTELLTAFINVSEPPCASSKPRDAQHDPVVDAVQAQFEQLQKQVTTVNRGR